MSAYAGSFNGFAFGSGAHPVSGVPGTVSVRSLTGFGDTKGTAVVTESPNGGGWVGRVSLGPKQVRLGFNLLTASESQLQTLRDEIDRCFVPSSVDLPLVIGSRMMLVRVLEIDPGRDPSWPGKEQTSPTDILFQAGDPTVLSAEEGDISFGGDTPVSTFVDLSFTNAGTRPTRSGAAWTLRVTAHGDTSGIYIENVTTGEIVTWQGLTLTGGQVLTVDRWRASRVGSDRVDSYRRSESDTFCNWPILYPGANTIRVGCATGAISGNFKPRSTFT